MKANELRIGSIISINGENVIVDHIKCNEDSVTVKDGFIIVFNGGDLETDGNDNIKPIPLTPSILEAAGFYQLQHFTVQNLWKKDFGRDRVLTVGDVGNPNEMVFITEEEPPHVKSVIVARNYDYDGKIYLHQLQNLYFSLTGTELEIDIEKLR